MYIFDKGLRWDGLECHEGNERRDCNGDRIVDILLVYEDPDLVNDVITDAMTDELPFNF